MKLRMLISIFLYGAAAAIAVTVPHYVFSPAGNYPGAVETDPNGANLFQIVGFFLLPGGATHAYIQTGKSFVAAQPSGSFTSYLFAINASGLAVGGFCYPNDLVCGDISGAHGYTYNFNTGAASTIDYPGAATTVAYGINDAGVIVGGLCDQGTSGCPLDLFNVASHGFLDNNGVFSQIDYPGSSGTTAFAINKGGIVAGTYESGLSVVHAFVLENGQYTDINYPGANWSEATGVNDLGVVVGHFQDASFNVNGFMYYKGQFAQINVQPGHTTAIWGINKRNDLVGTWLGARGQSDTFKAIPKH